MEQLIEFIKQENEIIDNEVHDSQLRWRSFWNGFASHTSVMKIEGCPLMAPVVSMMHQISTKSC